MSESEGADHSPRFGRIRGLAIKAIGAAGIGLGLAGMYNEGVMNDVPKSQSVEAGEVTPSNRDYIGKLAVDGMAIDKDGNLVEISSLKAHPLKNEVHKQEYLILPNRELGEIQVFNGPSTTSAEIEGDFLNSNKVDPDGRLVATLVYGDIYGDPDDRENIFGHSEVGRDINAGFYWKIEGVDQNGQPIDAFISSPSGLVDSPVTSFDVSK